jgi:hypothetical protein
MYYCPDLGEIAKPQVANLGARAVVQYYDINH